MYASEKQLRNEAKHLKELIDNLASNHGEEIAHLFGVISQQQEIIGKLQEQIDFIRDKIDE